MGGNNLKTWQQVDLSAHIKRLKGVEINSSAKLLSAQSMFEVKCCF